MLINIIFCSFFICLILTNILINIFSQHSVGQHILKEAPESHLAKEGTVTMGGLAIMVTIIVALLVHTLTGNEMIDFKIVSVILVLTGFGLIGLIDDLSKVFKQKNKGLTAGVKLLLQIILASIFVGLLAASNHYESSSPILQYLPESIYYIFCIFLVVGASNAVNLSDGLDGLAGGVLLIAFLGILYFAFMQSALNLIVILLMIIGSLLGFLWFNINPAKIFMGDTGSLSLGSVLAAIAILIHKELHLAILGFIFVIEALSVILQVSFFKLTKGKRIFRMAPFHHHLELIGWTENKIVIRFWIISIIMVLISIKIG